MKTYIDKLGKVAITVEENYWNINNDYDKLTVVEKEGIFGTYISRKPVPAGTELTNRKYWIPFSSLKEEIVINYNTFIDKYKGELEKIGVKLTNHEDRIKAIEAIENLINQLIDKTNQSIAASKTMANEAANSVSSANKVLGKANEALRDAKSVREEAQAAAATATNASNVAKQVAYDAEKVLRRAEEANKTANEASNKATEALDTSKKALCTAKYYLSLAQELKEVVDKIWNETIIHHEAIKKALADTKKLHDDMRDEIANINKSIANINETLTLINNSVSEVVKDVEKNNTDIQNLFDNKVDKVKGKELSTNDFTNELKEKLDSLFNYDDTELREKLETLITNFNTLVNDNPTKAIENFNEIIAFLENIEDSETLDGIIAGIETQIANINKSIEDLSKTVTEAGKNNEDKFSEIDESIASLNNDKVDKEDGKGLSSNDFTDDYKDKLTSATSTQELTKEEYDALEEIDNKTIYIVDNNDKKEIWLNGEQINKSTIKYFNFYKAYIVRLNSTTDSTYSIPVYEDYNETSGHKFLTLPITKYDDTLYVLNISIDICPTITGGSHSSLVYTTVYIYKGSIIQNSKYVTTNYLYKNINDIYGFTCEIGYDFASVPNKVLVRLVNNNTTWSDWNETNEHIRTFIKNKPTKLSQFENDSNFVNATQVDERFEQLVGAAPADLDTLEEIAEKLQDEDDIHTALVQSISEKVNKNGDNMTGVLGVPDYVNIKALGANKAAFGYSDTQGAYLYNYAKDYYLGIKDDGTPHFNGNKLWHSGNDGTGSDLDADLLDGYHASTASTTNTIPVRDANGIIDIGNGYKIARFYKTITASGWYRIYHNNNSGQNQGQPINIQLGTWYNYKMSESYIINIVIAVGQPPVISQIGNHPSNEHLIDKIRIYYKLNTGTCIDVHINGTNINDTFYCFISNGIYARDFLEDIVVPEGYTLYEFNTGNGFKNQINNAEIFYSRTIKGNILVSETSNSPITTEQFLTKLHELGAFLSNNHTTFICDHSYAKNDYIETNVGNISLSGAVINIYCYSYNPNIASGWALYQIDITTATVNNSVPNAYNNTVFRLTKNGTNGYIWSRLVNSSELPLTGVWNSTNPVNWASLTLNGSKCYVGAINADYTLGLNGTIPLGENIVIVIYNGSGVDRTINLTNFSVRNVDTITVSHAKRLEINIAAFGTNKASDYLVRAINYED